MGLALYTALTITCIIWIHTENKGEEYFFNWYEIYIMVLFTPFIVSIVGLIDIYDDVVYWYKEGTCND